MILFTYANRLVRARNVRFAVAKVTGNVKHIRNGDYRLLSGGRGGGLGTTLLLRLRSKKNRSSYAVSSLFDHVQNKIFLLILDVSYLDPRKKLFILCHWKSHTSE